MHRFAPLVSRVPLLLVWAGLFFSTGCGKLGGGGGIVWDDPTGDVRGATSGAVAPPDITRVAVRPEQGCLRIEIETAGSLLEYLSKPDAAGRLHGAALAELLVDTDDNPQTGGAPVGASDAGRQLGGYEARLSVNLGFISVSPDGSIGRAGGTISVDGRRDTMLARVGMWSLFALGRETKLPDRRALMSTGEFDDSDFCELSERKVVVMLPRQLLGAKPGATVRLAWRDFYQTTGNAYSDDRKLTLDTVDYDLAKRARMPRPWNDLFKAAEEGNAAHVAAILSAGAARALLGPALLRATMGGHAGIVQTLLDKGADPNFVDAGGQTPVFMAAVSGKAELVKLLLANGARTDQRTSAGETALIRAVARGDLPMVTALLAAGADPRIALQNGATAMTYAEQREDRPMIEALKSALAKGPQPTR